MNNANIVVKKLADRFWVRTNNQTVCARPMGKLKANGIFVGDLVELRSENKEFFITKVFDRKNKLIRPPLANLEQLVIVVATVPKPDFFIVDKLLLFAYSNGIEPVLVVNKVDIDIDVANYVQSTYSGFVTTFYVSAKNKEGLSDLKQALRGKISAFSGQSAVGKSALVNSLFPEHKTIEGELSEKSERGKNTTRHAEIFVSEDIYIADTAGFTSLDETLLPIKYYELPFYYPDYLEAKKQCKYNTCVHFKEPREECCIKTLVYQGKLDRQRYERYRKIYEMLNERWVKTHG